MADSKTKFLFFFFLFFVGGGKIEFAPERTSKDAPESVFLSFDYLEIEEQLEMRLWRIIKWRFDSKFIPTGRYVGAD